MLKTSINRTVHGFCYAVAINAIIYEIIMLISGKTPMLPEYVERFDNELQAFITQLVLIGLLSAVFSGGTVILETKKMGLIIQSILYFILTSAVWVPIGCICWGLNKYIQTMISFGASYVVSYIICWVIQYRTCKKNIDEINRKLEEDR